MIYLDSSAILKLANVEKETEALKSFLEQQSGHVVSSSICRIEVLRGARRQSSEVLAEARRHLELIELLAITGEVLTLAADLGPPELRSLDAIHLATAEVVRRELAQFVTYDRVLSRAASNLGFEVRSPN